MAANKINSLSQSRLQEVLNYDPATGEFRWKIALSKAIKLGQIAGSIDSKGRRQIQIDRRMYFAHRLAFLYMLGRWPTCQVDHINRDFTDNRWENLRDATPTQNATNRVLSSPVYTREYPRGAYLLPSGRYWSVASINGRRVYLGTFDSPKEAHEAYTAARRAHIDKSFLP